MLAARRRGGAGPRRRRRAEQIKWKDRLGKTNIWRGKVAPSLLPTYLPQSPSSEPRSLGAARPPAPAHPVFLFTASAATQFSIVERPSDNAEIARQYLPEGNPGWKME